MILVSNSKVYQIRAETIVTWGKSNRKIYDFMETQANTFQELQKKFVTGEFTENQLNQSIDELNLDRYMRDLCRMVFTDLYKTMGKEEFNTSFLLENPASEAGTLVHEDYDRSGLNLDTGDEIMCEVCMAKLQERLDKQKNYV